MDFQDQLVYKEHFQVTFRCKYSYRETCTGDSLCPQEAFLIAGSQVSVLAMNNFTLYNLESASQWWYSEPWTIFSSEQWKCPADFAFCEKIILENE